MVKRGILCIVFLLSLSLKIKEKFFPKHTPFIDVKKFYPSKTFHFLLFVTSKLIKTYALLSNVIYTSVNCVVIYANSPLASLTFYLQSCNYDLRNLFAFIRSSNIVLTVAPVFINALVEISFIVIGI